MELEETGDMIINLRLNRKHEPLGGPRSPYQASRWPRPQPCVGPVIARCMCVWAFVCFRDNTICQECKRSSADVFADTRGAVGYRQYTVCMFECVCLFVFVFMIVSGDSHHAVEGKEKWLKQHTERLFRYVQIYTRKA